jgi:signal transduction histidine kinase
MMITLLCRKGRENRIGRRLIVLIVAFSSFLALLATGYQLLDDYQDQRNTMDSLLEEVHIFLPQITSSVWTFDEGQITLALDALIRLPHIESATITTSDGRNTWHAGTAQSRRQITRQYPLTHTLRNQALPIGTLTVLASLDGIYDRLVSQAVTILVSNTLKTFLVTAFMYVIFSRIVTRRITHLSRNIVSLVPESLLSEVSLYDEHLAFPENGDEIDRLRWAYDNIARQLTLAVQDLHDRHHQLEYEIQERIRAETNLQKVITELSRTNAELERFAFVAAHDLQEPVRGLVSFSQLLERKCAKDLGSDGKDYLHFIMKEALRMSNLVRDLLEYGRARSLDLAPQELDIQDIIDDVTQSLRQTIEQKQADLRIGPMPRLVADPVQLHHVFLNLIANALTYTAAPHPEIEIKAEHQDAAWQFQVTDNGIGIDPQYHDYIFEAFRRLHTNATYPGTGIGLAVCKRIVELHGGRIWLSSATGAGTTFFFTIPDAKAGDVAVAD